MIDGELRELVVELREAMQEVSPVPLPPLPGPATEEEMAATEAGLGFSLPAEVRAIYSIARGGRIGVFDVTPIDMVAECTADNLESLVEMELISGAPDPEHWYGEIPEGDLLVVSWDPPVVTFYECSGPLAGRLVQFEFQGVGDVWGRIGNSLIDCFRWQLAAFRMGALKVWPFREDDIAVHVVSDFDLDQLLTELRPHLVAAGATPAYFERYEPPPGFISPARAPWLR